MVVAAVLGLPRAVASVPRAPLPVAVRPSAGAGRLSTVLVVAGRFCLAGLAGSGRQTQAVESLKSAAAARLLLSSTEVAAVGEKVTIGLAVSRREQDPAKRCRTSWTVSRSAG